jgi:hypothetical protein
MEPSPHPGDRLTTALAPDAGTLGEWIGPDALNRWRQLEAWIEQNYPGVFAPEWLNGGRKRGWSLRYKKTKAFCTLIPGFGGFSVVIVFGGAERENFEERRNSWRDQLIELYDSAKTYPDGRFLTLAVSSSDDLEEVKELLIMKRPPPLGRTARRPSAAGAAFSRSENGHG